VLDRPRVQRILVADDDPDLVTLVARRLGKAGYAVIAAHDGQEALDQAIRHLPELAVLDVMMPKLTGLEVLERLRATTATQHIPVILMSAGSWHVDVNHLPPGAAGFVRKPSGMNELPERVRDLLARVADAA